MYYVVGKLESRMTCMTDLDDDALLGIRRGVITWLDAPGPTLFASFWPLQLLNPPEHPTCKVIALLLS